MEVRVLDSDFDYIIGGTTGRRMRLRVGNNEYRVVVHYVELREGGDYWDPDRGLEIHEHDISQRTEDKIVMAVRDFMREEGIKESY